MKRLLTLCIALGALLLLLCGVGGALFFATVLNDLPEIYALEDYRPSIVTHVLARDGREIGAYYKERREIVPIEQMPTYLVQAFISSEDDAFYDHQGLDWPGIVRAALANLKAGGIRQGGSTITQQVAKTFLLSSERTWVRKLKDMVLAHRIEKHFDKNEILYLYLNQIYLGSGAYGVEAAARTYFGKSVSELSLSEAALIAGLVPAPSRYTPHVNPKAALRRQHFVLGRMLEEGYIDAEQRAAALEAPLEFVHPGWEEKTAAVAYFVEEVRRYLEEHFGSDTVLGAGLTVRTTLDLDRQIDAYRAVRRGLRAHDRRTGYRGPIRVVPRMEWPAVIRDLTRPDMPAPEPGGRIVRALVTEVDDTRGEVRLSLGPGEETKLTLEEIAWARPPDPETDGAATSIRRPSQALHPGYLVWLEKTSASLQEPDTEPGPRYALYQHPQAEGALVSMDIDTGQVRAMIGGYSFTTSQFNRGLQSYRQPGSAFKPVIYSAALDQGYTPASIVYDTPIVYEDAETGGTWKPGNYSDKFYGPITLRSALAHSRNIATIRLLRDIGIAPVLRMARALGIERSLQPNLSLALGSSEVTLAAMVRAYATFAAGGRHVKPIFILDVHDREGQRLARDVPLLPAERNAASDAPGTDSLDALLAEIRSTVDRADDPEALPAGYALDPVTAYLMTDMLKAVVHEGTGWRARQLGRPVAGKTGTTNDLHDAWFIGFTPQVVTGTWVGYDKARSLGKNETGSRAACPVFVDYMQHALRNLPKLDFSVPEGIVFARIDHDRGLLASPHDPKAVFLPFRDGTVPEERMPASNGTASVRPARLD